MTYHNFIRLRNEGQAYHTLTNGVYVGTNEEGDDIYKLYDFWVCVQENTKGFCYEARTTPPSYLPSEVVGAQEL
jgi:hypothetical protein